MPRHTIQRQAVLRAVKFSAQPLSVEEVLAQLTQTIAQATVYRNLEWLSRRGEIYRFTDDQGVTRYIGHAVRLADFQCQRCGDQQPMQVRLETIESEIHQYGRSGFIRLHAVGICRSCQRSAR